MRTGGISNKSLFNRILGWIEVIVSYREITGRNGIVFLIKKIIKNSLGLLI